MMRPPMQVSIIIPTYNRYSQLVRTIDHLVSQILAHELLESVEVLVVDDGSRAAISSQIRNYLGHDHHGFLRYLALPENKGASAARNAGVEASEGGVLVFLDDDIVPTDNFISAVMKTHHQHPEALVISGNLLPMRNDMYSNFWYYYYDAVFNKPGEQFYAIEMISSGNCSMKKSVLDLENPLFDTSLTSCEDLDLYFRLKKRGVSVYKDDGMTALNDCRRTLYGFLRQRLWWARGQEEVVARYGMAWISRMQKSHAVPIKMKYLHLYLLLRLARQSIKFYNKMRHLLNRTGR